jgi:hypothetical protein
LGPGVEGNGFGWRGGAGGGIGGFRGFVGFTVSGLEFQGLLGLRLKVQGLGCRV